MDKTLVQRLRSHFDGDATAKLCAEAAAEIERLREHGPEMQRGTTGDGKPWMGTMLDVLNDNAQAACVEAGIRREHAAEIERLAGDASHQQLIDKLRAEFPQHHVEISTYPAGGMIDVNACDECGSSESYCEIWRYHPQARYVGIDAAVEAIKAQIKAAISQDPGSTVPKET